MHTRIPRLLCVAAFIALASCHPDPGPSPYGEPPPGVEQRYSFGVFYDSYAVETLTIDDATAGYYIYEKTYSEAVEVDHVEGEKATRLTYAGVGWWGGAVHLLPDDKGQSYAAWKTLHVSFKSNDETFNDISVGMGSVGRAPVKLMASAYGYTHDGQWHTLQIPLSDFEAAGVDLTNISKPFTFGGGAGTEGESLLVDGLYLTK